MGQLGSIIRSVLKVLGGILVATGVINESIPEEFITGATAAISQVVGGVMILVGLYKSWRAHE